MRSSIDYAGTTLTVIDPVTGAATEAQLFVAALGASHYIYAEATWTQTLADWVGSHNRTFAFIGGVPAMVVSDNLKSGITKACFYGPGLNRTYAEMAAHYDTAVVPARPYKPSRIRRTIGSLASDRAFQASQSVFKFRQTRLTVSLPIAPPNSAASARRTRRVLVPARYADAISASAAFVRR